jgi:hypothetical protein
MKKVCFAAALVAVIAPLGCGRLADSRAPERAHPAEEPALAAPVPERCEARNNACLPASSWAQRLCGDVYEDLALYMFREGTPWTRFYMKHGLNAVNGWGPTVHEDLVAREEVLVIGHRGNDGMLQVEESSGTYDVLRWNGSCVTLDVNEVTSRTPPEPLNSRIEWWSLSAAMRDTLIQKRPVAEVLKERDHACKGASVGRASARCLQLDQEFMKTVASVVRQTPDLPPPASVP